MMLPVPWRASLAAVLFFFALAAVAQVAVPPLTARVTDLTGTLTPDQRKSLEERLAAFEVRKGSQVAVLIVPTTQPEAIEQYSIRVAEQWKVGRKGVDDGAILLVALKDRAVRIETGYGLEGALPDAVAKRIVDEHIVPRFKRGDYYGGLDAGISRIISVIEGEPLPSPAGRTSEGRPAQSGIDELVLIVGILVLVIGGIIRRIFGRFLGSGVIGGVAGFLGWLIVGSISAVIVTAFIAGLLSLMGSSGLLGRIGRSGGGGWHSGGSSGGWGGGGGGSWGGGGGSWGGGGGGFGGGGASGHW